MSPAELQYRQLVSQLFSRRADGFSDDTPESECLLDTLETEWWKLCGQVVASLDRDVLRISAAKMSDRDAAKFITGEGKP